MVVEAGRRPDFLLGPRERHPAQQSRQDRIGRLDDRPRVTLSLRRHQLLAQTFGAEGIEVAIARMSGLGLRERSQAPGLLLAQCPLIDLPVNTGPQRVGIPDRMCRRSVTRGAPRRVGLRELDIAIGAAGSAREADFAEYEG